MNAKAAIQDLFLPLKILVRPFKTFSQLAQNPSVKGLIPALGLTLAAVAAMQYATAIRINLQINPSPASPTNLVETSFFLSWFTNVFVSVSLYAVIYWLFFASALALISHLFGGKAVSLRVLFVAFGSLLSVFIITYVVRAAVYLALPSINFPFGSWPPPSADADAAAKLIEASWGPLFPFQFGGVFNFISLAWLVTLGAIGVKTIREISWGRAAIVSAVGLFVALFLLGVP